MRVNYTVKENNSNKVAYNGVLYLKSNLPLMKVIYYLKTEVSIYKQDNICIPSSGVICFTYNNKSLTISY